MKTKIKIKLGEITDAKSKQIKSSLIAQRTANEQANNNNKAEFRD